MSEVILESFARMIDGLPRDDPWAVIERSGFLDVLVAESEGGGGFMLEDLFPLAIEAGRRLAPADLLADMARRVADPVPEALAVTLVAGEMAGMLIAVEALTVEYAATRRQFGREIGRFQAIQQQLAVLAEEVRAARMAAEMAFVGGPLDAALHRAAVAKIRCNLAAEEAASIAHAVHGAIGISAEHSLHRYTRRLRELAMTHGGETGWSRRLGQWVLDSTGDITALARAL